MQMINKKILLVAFFLAITTSMLIFAYLSRFQKPKDKTEYSNVVVAVKTIEKKAVISENDVRIAKVVKSYVNAKAYTNVDDIIGKRAKESIIEGEQVLSDRVVEDEKLIMSYDIPEGKRAVSINVNEAVEVADFIRPGDFVDILATFDRFEVEDVRGKIIYPKTTKVVLQNIMILGVGQLTDVPEKPRTELPKTVTLAVTLEEAEKLVHSEENGVLRMALRRVGEHEIISTQGIIRSDLVPERGKIELIK